MRTALLADIHSNLQALTSVLVDVKDCGVEAMACLGDTVGYGANPGRCVDLIRALGCPCVMGNHDYYVTIDSPQIDEMMASAVAREEPVWSGIKLAREQLTEEQLAWLRGLELISSIAGALIAHAALHDFEFWPYLRSTGEARRTLEILGDKVGFFGHTHRENVFVPEGGAAPEAVEENLVRLPEGAVAVTVGSVGQPRDGDPRARWVLWDPSARTVEFRRVPYDVDAAGQAILEAGLSPLNAIRLFGDQ